MLTSVLFCWHFRQKGVPPANLISLMLEQGSPPFSPSTLPTFLLLLLSASATATGASWRRASCSAASTGGASSPSSPQTSCIDDFCFSQQLSEHSGVKINTGCCFFLYIYIPPPPPIDMWSWSHVFLFCRYWFSSSSHWCIVCACARARLQGDEWGWWVFSAEWGIPWMELNSPCDVTALLTWYFISLHKHKRVKMFFSTVMHKSTVPLNSPFHFTSFFIYSTVPNGASLRFKQKKNAQHTSFIFMSLPDFRGHGRLVQDNYRSDAK